MPSEKQSPGFIFAKLEKRFAIQVEGCESLRMKTLPANQITTETKLIEGGGILFDVVRVESRGSKIAITVKNDFCLSARGEKTFAVNPSAKLRVA